MLEQAADVPCLATATASGTLVPSWRSAAVGVGDYPVMDRTHQVREDPACRRLGDHPVVLEPEVEAEVAVPVGIPSVRVVEVLEEDIAHHSSGSSDCVDSG